MNEKLSGGVLVYFELRCFYLQDGVVDVHMCPVHETKITQSPESDNNMSKLEWIRKLSLLGNIEVSRRTFEPSGSFSEGARE